MYPHLPFKVSPFKYNLFKARLFNNKGWSVSPYVTDSFFFISLGMLELSFRFQTWYDVSLNAIIR